MHGIVKFAILNPEGGLVSELMLHLFSDLYAWLFHHYFYDLLCKKIYKAKFQKVH